MFNSDQDPMSSLEDRLRSWVPSAGGLDRDRMLFVAGRAQAQETYRAGTSLKLWKLATAAAVLLASGLGMAWHNERSQRRALELAFTTPALPQPAPLGPSPELIANHPEKAREVDPSSYLALVRRAKRPEDVAELEPHETAPQNYPKVRPATSPYSETLRPRDWDRVISL